MTIAELKKKENIVEYILYVWQMEDLVRAVKFDPSAIDGFLGGQFDEGEFGAEREWFTGLIRKMKNEKLQERGHISELTELLIELVYLYGSLQSVYKDSAFIAAVNEAKPFMEEFKSKSSESLGNDVEICLVALYGLLNLRLQKKEISEETMVAMTKFQKLMALLSDRYRKMKAGTLQVNLN